jgi:diguanylate cyclase (GGDEF)-like protein
LGRSFEAAALLGALAAVTLTVMRSELRLFFLVFPLLGWAAWRFGQRGAAPATLLVCGLAGWAAARGWGPFAGSQLLGNMITLQALDATVALTSFVTAAAVSERAKGRQALEEAAQRLEHEAVHDALTGLPDRKLVLDRLEQALARAKRTGGLTGVMFFDLDRFKVINDGLGHAEGDKVLVVAAKRLAGAMRPSDTVGRFGGDEFIVVCEQLENERAAVQIAERLAETIARPIPLESGDVVVTTSVGIALADTPAARSHALVRDADAAMYRAKQRGSACHEIFDQAMRQRALRRMELETELRAAIERGELRLFFQSQQNLVDARLVGVEALVRWQHPSRGILRPAEFIAVAEETGLIVPLGRWVLEAACRHLGERPVASQGLGSEVTVALNVSAKEIARPDYADVVSGVLERSGTNPSRIHLEITEGVLVDATEGVLRQLEALRALGLKVVVDDFGTGYSCLADLKRLPVDVIKVDRSFVADLGNDPGDGAIARAVVTLAHGMGFTCVAEGVETALQLERIRALGCELAQGYLLGRPQPAGTFQAFLG